MRKAMNKMMAAVCIAAAALSLGACGGGSSTSGSEPTETAAVTEAAEATEAAETEVATEAAVVPEVASEANVDPTTLNPGQNYSREDGTSDLWFSTNDESDYFWLNDANKEYYETGLSVYWVRGGEQILEGENNEVVDNHLVNDAESPLEFDLVFVDTFTAYDEVSQTWYYREGLQLADVENLFYDQYVESDKGNSLAFHADYTVDEVWSGSAGTGTWQVLNSTQIIYYPDDGSNNGYKFTYYVTEDNTLDHIECTEMGTYYVAAQ